MFFPPFSSFPVDWRRRNGLLPATCASLANTYLGYSGGVLRHMQPRALHCSGKNKGCQNQYWAEISGSFLIHHCFLDVHPFFSQEDVFHSLRKGSVFPAPGFISESFFFFLAIISVNNESFTQIFPFILICSSSAAASVHGWKRLNFTALWEVQQEFIVSKTWLEVSRSWLAGCLSQSMFFGVKDTKGC